MIEWTLRRFNQNITQVIQKVSRQATTTDKLSSAPVDLTCQIAAYLYIQGICNRVKRLGCDSSTASWSVWVDQTVSVSSQPAGSRCRWWLTQPGFPRRLISSQVGFFFFFFFAALQHSTRLTEALMSTYNGKCHLCNTVNSNYFCDSEQGKVSAH